MSKRAISFRTIPIAILDNPRQTSHFLFYLSIDVEIDSLLLSPQPETKRPAMARPDQSYPPSGSFNPYASPEVEVRPVAESTLGGPLVPCTVGDVLGRAWTVYQGRMGFCIAVLVVGYLVTLGALIMQSVGTAMIGAITPDPIVIGALTLVLFLAYSVVAIWIGIGQSLAYLKVAQDRPATLGDLFGGGSILFKSLLAFLIVGLAFFGAMLLATIPGAIASAILGPNAVATNVLFGLGLLAGFTFVSIYWVYISQFYYVLIANPTVGALGSLKYSMQITKGHWWTITALYFLAGLVNLAGVLLLGIGLLFSIPLSFLILAVTYTSLAPQPVAAVVKPTSDYLD